MKAAAMRVQSSALTRATGTRYFIASCAPSIPSRTCCWCQRRRARVPKWRTTFRRSFARLSLFSDHLRTVLAVKGSLRRAQQRRALDGSGPFRTTLLRRGKGSLRTAPLAGDHFAAILVPFFAATDNGDYWTGWVAALVGFSSAGGCWACCGAAGLFTMPSRALRLASMRVWHGGLSRNCAHRLSRTGTLPDHCDGTPRHQSAHDVG